MGHTGAVVTARESLDAQAAADLLARHMWIADKLAAAGDEIAGLQAAEDWDGDCLLTDTYEEYETRAREAIRAVVGGVS